MNTMRLNYTNAGITISLLVVLFIFYQLFQRSNSVASPEESVTKSSIRDHAERLVSTQLKKAQDTILSLKNSLVEAQKAQRGSNMEFGKKKFLGQKLVHLDLKGAPTKMDYLLKLLPYFKKWGATGLLVEYEDTFPYKEEFEVLRAKNAYSEDDIKRFVELAQENDLIVIPLVQTFGHLEFVLKHKEFANLRETPQYSNSLCPNNKDSVPMVRALIDQVMALHPDSKWFHIGGDEVWNLKTCPVCVKDKQSKSELFLKHVTPILQHLRSKDRTPLMWDDMMRDWNIDQLKELSLLVEPMVWAYQSDLTGSFPPGMWDRYATAFSKIWAASAFKGATRPWHNFVPIGFHVENNLNWLDIIAKLPDSTEVIGVALTGWSRFDHYATLCELLPAALPSLAFCLQALSQGYIDEALRKSTAKDLGFPETFSLNVDRFFHYKPPDGTFPGHEVFPLVGRLQKALYDMAGVFNIEHGWMLDREVKERFLSFYQMEHAYNKTVHGLAILTSLQEDAEKVMLSVYDKSVVDEWVKDKIEGTMKYLNTMKVRLEELKSVASET